MLSYCSEHRWRRRKPIKENKKSIFFSDQVLKGHRARLHSSKPSKGTSNTSNKKTQHRRKRRHRSARSKSHKRSPESTQGNVPESDVPSSAMDMRSMSDDEEEEDSIDIINNQFAQMTCEGEQELCDDSDSLDEALDAECLDEETTFNASNHPSTNVQ